MVISQPFYMPLFKNLKIIFLIIFFFCSVVTFSQPTTTDSCSMPTLPSIHFRKGSVILMPKAKVILDSIVKICKQYPDCRVKVISHSDRSRKGQELSWDKTNFTIQYLVKKGVSSGSLIFWFGEIGDPLIVDLISTSDVEPPSIRGHPSLRL